MTFKSVTETLSFEISSENDDLINNFIEGMFNIFGDLEAKKIEALQQNTTEVNNKVNEHIKNFKDNFPPILNNIPAFFRKMKVDEYFLFLPNLEINAEASMRLNAYLRMAGEGLDASKMEAIDKDLDELYGELFKNYDMFSFGVNMRYIGQRIKSKRICRFCSKGEPDVTFRKSAHAISEALGNKNIFLFEECDVCNDKFSMEIEPDLISYMTIFRSVYDIKGKGGSKKIKGKNFELENDGKVQIRFNSDTERPKKNEPYKLNLHLQQKVIFQDIYRCLCKFFISVVDHKFLENFPATINWINKKTSIKNLPSIAETISYYHFTKQPTLYIYIRKGDDNTLPYAVGEFHFTCTITVFIIPLSLKDEKDFLNDHDYKHFWEKFKHYRSIHWSYNDFSSEIEKDLTFLISVDKDKKEE